MTSDEMANHLLRDPAWQGKCICAACAEIPMIPRNLNARMWDFVLPRVDCPLAGKPECIGVQAMILTIETRLRGEHWLLANRKDTRTRRANFLSFSGDINNGGYVLCPYFMQMKLPHSERRGRAEQMKRALERAGLKARIDSADYVYVPFDQKAELVPDCASAGRGDASVTESSR